MFQVHLSSFDPFDEIKNEVNAFKNQHVTVSAVQYYNLVECVFTKYLSNSRGRAIEFKYD